MFTDVDPVSLLVSLRLPGLCPDWETWDPSQPVENAREAMQQADDWLGVPQVYTHTYTHAYIHTHSQLLLRTSAPTYTHTCTHTYTHRLT